MSPTNLLSLESLARYWSHQEVALNIIIFFNLIGALLLGLLVGYERSYHGRAAGMRTYGLVCMASCAIVVVTGYPGYWYAGAGAGVHSLMGGVLPPDPTRVIQGVVTGIGFLGAGVIMKEGMNISGLTTAASIWSSSAIGVLVGVGFYAAAILLAVLSAALMMWAARLEQWLPSRPAISLVLRFCPGFSPDEDALKREAHLRGYEVAPGSFRIQFIDGRQEWRCIAIALGRDKGMPLSRLSQELVHFEGVAEFELAHARN